MYQEVGSQHFYTLFINNNIFFFPELEKYITTKVLVRRIKPTSLKTILSTLKSFIIWSLANPDTKEELAHYLSRYLHESENGFQIFNKIFIQDLDEEIEYCLLTSKAKQSSTLDKDKAIIEDFLKSTNQKLFDTFNLKKNISSLNHANKNSIHNGYALSMGSLAQKAFAKDVSIIPQKVKPIGYDIKAFPYQLFNALLELASEREKLIYLLSGACSARIAQVLNLTLYDFDYSAKQVWLIDPRSNDQLGVHGIGRKSFLKDVYQINASKDKPHANIGFKAPIPLRYKNRLPLYWISNKYRELFFNTLASYKFVPESSRVPRHPFFFVTSSGARLTPQQVNVTFLSHCKTLKNKYPQYTQQLDGLGLHSLRHMFGVMMATFQANLIINKKRIKQNIPNEQIKIITKEAMGHRSIQSTEVYFNRPWHLDIELGESLKEIYDEMMKTMTFEELEDKYNVKRFTKRKR